jgi:hypothetical protein
MEISKELAEQIQLNETQIKAIQDASNNFEAELKKSWDGKANNDAENILSDVAKKVETMTGIKKEQGVKYADYLGMASENYLKGQKSDLDRLKGELEEKIKSGTGDELTKKELEKVRLELEKNKSELDKYKVIAAEHEDWKANDYKGKYEVTYEKLTSVEEKVAFQSIKPTFPDTVNKYEAAAKWKEFVDGVKSKNKIVEENDEYYAIDKENEHKKVKLSSLVEKDKDIQDLTKGRSMTGLGSQTKQGQKSIDGVPFKIEEGATGADIQKAIKDYLTTELKLEVTSKDYATKFGEFYAKIKAQKTAQ